MTAVEEFALGEAQTPDGGRSPRARRREHATGWVALGVIAIVLGALCAPVMLPRPVGEIPGWGGLGRLIVIVVSPQDDAVAAAEQRLATADGITEDGHRYGTVVWAVAPAAAIEPTSLDDPTYDLGPITLFDDLATARAGVDWVCEPEPTGVATCTALDDEATVVVLDPDGTP